MHQQQGFPCIYAEETVSHKSQTAGQAAESCERADSPLLVFTSYNGLKPSYDHQNNGFSLGMSNWAILAFAWDFR